MAENTETKGIILFNRGDRMLVRILVALYSLRKYYNGSVTFYVEPPCPCPNELDDALKYFGCNVVHLDERHDYKTLIRKTSLFGSLGTANYDKTLWIDSDVVVLNSLDGMFDLLGDDVDLVIPHFANWWSDGRSISKRIKRFEGLIDQKYIDEALKHHPAINTGVLSFRNTNKWKNFVDNIWIPLSDKAANKHVFIADEVGLQVLMPSLDEFGIKTKIAPSGYNISVLHDHDQSKEKFLAHMHGDKHVLDTKNSEYWRNTLQEMRENNTANINYFLQYSDKRLKVYLSKENSNSALLPYQTSDVTIVSACDPYYVEILRHTYGNWRRYKNIDKCPVIIFVNGLELNDSRLDFLRLPNVQLISWSKEKDLDNVTDHREEMLSAFFIGAARYVKTDYWLKLDADSIATDNREFIIPAMKQYSIFSHRWGYSRPDHIRALDSWVLTCPKHRGKLALSKPMIEQGRIEGHRFYHNSKRFISYICLQKTRFTRFCVGLFKERRLPCPSQDTTAYFLIQKFKPEAMGIGNFKRDYGFTQLRGKLGADHIKKCVEQVDINNSNSFINQSSESSQGDVE